MKGKTKQAETLLAKPYSPGHFIKSDILDEYGLTQEDLAERLGVSRRTINQIVGGKRGLTAQMALRLEKLTGSSAEYWMNLDARFGLWSTRVSEDFEGIEPL